MKQLPRPCYASVVNAAAPTSKEAIWAAATELFAREGYSGTTVRDIATAAGVDPALVMRHYGSKERLFLDTMTAALTGPPMFSGPAETLGEDVIEYILGEHDQVRGVFLALVRASGADAIGPRLRSYHETAFVAPLRNRLTGDDAELRARLAAALVGGLLYALWVVEDTDLQADAPERVIHHYGALLQQLITPGVTQ